MFYSISNQGNQILNHSVLAYSFHYNKIPQTELLLKNRNVLLTGAAVPRSGCQHGHARALSQVTDFSLCPPRWKGPRRFLESFYKSTNPIHEGSVLMT